LGEPGALLLNTTVSRTTARIAVGDDDATLAELGSQTGTSVNVRRISNPVLLSDSDRIRLGLAFVTCGRGGALTTEWIQRPPKQDIV
jgi:hypothetical protein